MDPRSCAALVMAAGFAALGAGAAPERASATYQVRLLGTSPPRFSVRAELPIDGTALEMARSFPAELPEMAAHGWPALVSGLRVVDAAGAALTPAVTNRRGWTLPRPLHGRVTLSYEVDFGLFERHGWSSPLESAVADDQHLSVAARGLFITTPAVTSAEVAFAAPPGWRPVVPWRPRSARERTYLVPGVPDLTDNLLVFSTVAPEVVTAASFTVQVTTMGHWVPLRPTLRKVLSTILTREVALMQYTAPEDYSVVLVPTADQGGEAYRQSFAYCFEDPSEQNQDRWGNTLAHEIFHYWNAARLKGADYRSTQWFQEGFTEYVANLTLSTGRLSAPDALAGKLEEHLENARRLTTTLEDIGTHKGPPLYSAGALVAFSWDVTIRAASGGKRNLGDFFRALWQQTGQGLRPYAWPDLKAALQATAEADWEGYYQASIRGHEPLPLERTLRLAGLRLSTDDTGRQRLQPDPGAPASARALWLALTRGDSTP